MHIAALHIYPVKGLRGLNLPQAQLERCGLQHDRRWAILRNDGRVLTQRDLPAMARIEAHPEPGGLRLECAHHGGISATPDGAPVTLEVWRTKVPARTANQAASAWLTKVLATPCTLAYLEDPTARPVTPHLAHPGDVVSLADGFPLLVTTTASLEDLNRRLEAPVPMARFRPNVVIEGATPYAEDTWSHIQTGPVRLRLASPCARCKVITLDQRTGSATPRLEPLRTLGTYRRSETGTVTFGWNAIPETLGSLSAGMPIAIR